MMEPFPALEYLPLMADALRLDRICPADLVKLRRLEEEEDFQRVTCRPVRTWTDGELLERTGFRRDGVLRQHHQWDGVLWDDYLYSLLAEDFSGSI